MNSITRIRNSYFTKGVAMLLALNIMFEIVWPTAAMALTSGPSQPEFQSFEPVETTDMVNLFTGDFTYNIPLMNVPGPNGGYPINLSYHANPSMDQEASWVGLGWNINAGAINRMVRGVPDDFDGDIVKEKTSMKDSWTAGLGVNVCLELFGGDFCEGKEEEMLNLGFNIRFNSYKGFGYSFDPSIAANDTEVSFDAGLSLDSEDGIGVNARFGLNKEKSDKNKVKYSVTNYHGLSFNSKRGLGYSSGRSVSLIKGQGEDIKQNYNERSSAGLSFTEGTHNLVQALPMNNYRLRVSVGTGPSTFGSNPKLKFSGYYDTQRLKNKGKEMFRRTYGYENMHDEANYGDFARTNDGDVRKTSSNLAMPQLTHDVYAIQGQGIGGSFRPYRNEVGRVFDPKVNSVVAGGYFNLEGGKDKVGFGGGAVLGGSSQKAWDRKNNRNDIRFTKTMTLQEIVQYNEIVNYLTTTYPEPNQIVFALIYLRENDYTLLADQIQESGVLPSELPLVTAKEKEDYYYKVNGEKTSLPITGLDYVGGEVAIGGKIKGNAATGNYKLDQLLGGTILKERPSEKRVARNNLVHKVTNTEISDFHPDVDILPSNHGEDENTNALGELEIFYHDWDAGDDLKSNPTRYLKRKGEVYKSHHNGAYKVLDDKGSYYVYGLPVYNTKKVEKVFSINAAVDNGAGQPIHKNLKSTVPFETEGEGDEKDVKFKHTNTHKFYDSKETPAYAYSYLLTSILGADYVDVDNNGPSDGDRGYWVKMDYVKYADKYKWRSPYRGCMYSMGNPATLEDDKGSYQYGEKEVWYMSRLETETHIAFFELSERADNYEAESEFTEIGAAGRGEKSGLKLDAIKLYEKKHYVENPTEAVPVQTVHFKYSYELCPNVQNNDGSEAESGKLTLTDVYFTHEGNTRGAMTPYHFEYEHNKPYSLESYDRWGNYKREDFTAIGESGIGEINQVLPYTNQYQQGYWGKLPSGEEIVLNSANQEAYQTIKDQNASVWSLSKISLPSGGTIAIDYEADDYAYVQSERATQMTYITRVNDNTTEKNSLYKQERVSETGENDFRSPDQRRIYFKLEDPIKASDYPTPEALSKKIYRDYVNELKKDESGKRNVYFKSFINLKGDIWDYVSGYLPLEDEGVINYNNPFDLPDAGTIAYQAYGVSSQPEDLVMIGGEMHYTQGFITVESAKRKTTGAVYGDYHPIALAAWQYIRSSSPQLLQDMGSFNESEIINSKRERAKKVKNLFSFIPELTKMFKGYRRFSYKKELAQNINLNRSMIRLTTPDKKKYGGGARVKQIVMSDNWNSFEATENSEDYGLAYDYRTKETIDGQAIYYSSGVAQYEPMIGGDEIALRYPKFFPGKLPFHTDNNLFFEHPINEAYMPAPIVGYSEVTVSSLNTANQIKKAQEGTLTEPEQGRGVTGVEKYEFYTAKNYPVITEQTNLGRENGTLKSWNVPLVIPFVASYRRNKIAATQGYKIELNDMHGKLKSKASYGLDDAYQVKEDYISKVTYEYKSSDHITSVHELDKQGVKRLANVVSTLSFNPVTRSYIQEDRIVGVEHEFFTDQRHSKSSSLEMGANNNIDAITVPVIGKLPIPSFWGTLNSDKKDVRTYVTNKIIRKSGILERIVSENESYVSTLKNVKFDAATGRPLLTETSNEFKDKIYKLSHPAHWEYDGMGQAYKNINLEFKADLQTISSNNLFKGGVPASVIDKLVPGDEFIAMLKDPDDALSKYKNYKATFISKNYGTGDNAVFHVERSSKLSRTGGNLSGYFKVYRSGRRNHYLTDAGSITSKSDPLSGANMTTATDNYAVVSGDLADGDATIVLKINKLNEGVLAASAITFKDNWKTNLQAHENPHSVVENPYKVGQTGIWRPYKNYVYAGKRSQTLDGTVKAPNVREDGVMSNVPLFNWQVADFERYVANWEYANEITRINKFGYETENKDRLGIYSAALYGYNHSLPVAVGSNATYREIGREDFETFSEDLSRTNALQHEKESNLFIHGESTLIGNRYLSHSDKYKIVGGKIGAENYVLLDLPFESSYWTDKGSINIAVNTSNNEGLQQGRLFNATKETVDEYIEAGKSYTRVNITANHSSITDGAIRYLPNALALGGVATVSRSVSYDQIYATTNATIALSDEAHTGKKSLKLTGTSVEFFHGSLQLIPGKRYVISYWAKRDEPSFDYGLNNALEVYVALPGGDPAPSELVKSVRKTKVIEGWQQIEAEIEIDPADYSTPQAITTRFKPISSANATTPLYIDDLRIAPKTGGILTYVYDPISFRLVATLNANNYATYYYYDEQGNLYLTKQETEKGIFTVNAGHTNTKNTTIE